MTKSGLQGIVQNLGWVMTQVRRPKTPSDTHTQKKPWTTKSFCINCIKISNVKVETLHKYQNQPETVCDVCTLPNSTELLL